MRLSRKWVLAMGALNQADLTGLVSRIWSTEVAGEGTGKQPLKGEALLPREGTLANTQRGL